MARDQLILAFAKAALFEFFPAAARAGIIAADMAEGIALRKSFGSGPTEGDLIALSARSSLPNSSLSSSRTGFGLKTGPMLQLRDGITEGRQLVVEPQRRRIRMRDRVVEVLLEIPKRQAAESNRAQKPSRSLLAQPPTEPGHASCQPKQPPAAVANT